jgi:hypothetical protein
MVMPKFVWGELFVSFKGLMNPRVVRQVIDVVIRAIDRASFIPKYRCATVLKVKPILTIQPY